MGRPPKGETAARKRMVIRVTEAAHEELHRRASAAGLEFSEWALAILLADPPPQVPASSSTGDAEGAG